MASCDSCRSLGNGKLGLLGRSLSWSSHPASLQTKTTIRCRFRVVLVFPTFLFFARLISGANTGTRDSAFSKAGSIISLGRSHCLRRRRSYVHANEESCILCGFVRVRSDMRVLIFSRETNWASAPRACFTLTRSVRLALNREMTGMYLV